MQLNSKKPLIKNALRFATQSLLGTSLITPAIAAVPKWEMNASAFYYHELERIRVFEETLYIKKDLGNNEFVSLKQTSDIMTGASPSGEIAQAGTTTTTTPSGTTLVSGDNQTPMGHFQDIRFALAANWVSPLSRLWTLSSGVNYSYEYDYRSHGASLVVSKDANRRSTTFTAGISGNFDVIEPVNGVPEATQASTSTVRADNDIKSIIDVTFGISQVLDRYRVVEIAYFHGYMKGYLNDPYKFASQVGGDSFNESRPGLRQQNSLSIRLLQYKQKKQKGDVIDLKYRYYSDDWAVQAHSLDVNYRRQLDKTTYFRPHIRMHYQTAARFYLYSLDNFVPNFFSADYRLAELYTLTVGGLYGIKINKLVEARFRTEYLHQGYLNRKLDKLQSLIFQAVLEIKY
ncbi:MAG: DUF3570 domain-containing protein [Gammaproteobacteria bacterium]|nr:DUF3570 domain-containing protein [Gammaproteobacteria bacterium]MDH5729755.1 DUF3570 domain-containing protein [Gammaproteobacteria bacterium]